MHSVWACGFAFPRRAVGYNQPWKKSRVFILQRNCRILLARPAVRHSGVRELEVVYGASVVWGWRAPGHHQGTQPVLLGGCKVLQSWTNRGRSPVPGIVPGCRAAC